MLYPPNQQAKRPQATPNGRIMKFHFEFEVACAATAFRDVSLAAEWGAKNASKDDGRRSVDRLAAIVLRGLRDVAGGAGGRQGEPKMNIRFYQALSSSVRTNSAYERDSASVCTNSKLNSQIRGKDPKE